MYLPPPTLHVHGKGSMEVTCSAQDIPVGACAGAENQAMHNPIWKHGVRSKMQPFSGRLNQRQRICMFSLRRLVSRSAGLMRCPVLGKLGFSSPGLPISSRREACLPARSWPSLSRARLQGSYSSALLHPLESGLPPRLFQVPDIFKQCFRISLMTVFTLVALASLQLDTMGVYCSCRFCETCTCFPGSCSPNSRLWVSYQM